MTEERAGIALTLAGGANVFAYGKEDHQPATFTVLNFEVDDVDAAVDRLTEAGVTMEHYDGMTDEKGVMRGHGPGDRLVHRPGRERALGDRDGLIASAP